MGLELRLLLELHLFDGPLILVAGLLFPMKAGVINLSLAEILEFPGGEIALQLFNFILFRFHVEGA